jgi:ArsR family metal-binding transcriptional regulator
MIVAIQEVVDEHSFPAREPVEDAEVQEAKTCLAGEAKIRDCAEVLFVARISYDDRLRYLRSGRPKRVQYIVMKI